MRTGGKAQRRKLRSVASSDGRAGLSPATVAHHTGKSAELDSALASAIAVARAAYQLCARTTRDPNVAVAVTSAAASLASSFGVTATPRLGDRLRLEWLAAMGDADARLLAECARVLGDAIAHHDSDRLRLASAEAHSLARAVASEAAWRAPASSVAFLSFAR